MVCSPLRRKWNGLEKRAYSTRKVRTDICQIRLEGDHSFRFRLDHKDVYAINKGTHLWIAVTKTT